MNKKMSKRQRDIKTKLMAAICMLLVSSIMMVSTTYAWFTLSTAPEVTGIQTAVGANGNLEMALQPYSGNLNDIKSESGDSLKLPAERNITWGNLVDVSDNATYGMNNIVLYPAQLNVSEGVIGGNPLATPKFGADGRVASVTANTLTGAFDPNKAQFSEAMTVGAASYTNAKGVRAIGVSSNMSARELAHRTALATAVAEKSGANSDAGKTLNRNGSAVGKIAVKHALSSGGETYTQEDIAGLKAAVADLDAIADRIEKALKSYLLANSIAPASAENTYVDLVTKINAAETLAAAEAVAGAIVPTDSAYTTAKSELAEMRAAITTAQGINDLTGDAIEWNALSSKLSVLVNIDKVTVNDMTMSEISAEGGKDALIEKLSQSNYTAILKMPSGSGIFADIADFTGSYSASFSMTVNYNGMNLPVNTEMYAVPAGTSYLEAIKAADFSSGDGTTTTAKPISTFYGYIIDLAFRTNAAGSYLQLQQEATDRIYAEDGNNPDTMGHGANMTFKTDSKSFGNAGVKSLMQNIRVIFFETDTNKIIAYAKLDANAATSTDAGVTMPLMLTDATFANAKVDDTTTTDVDESIAIMALTQNEAKALSVMVYLDGTSMTNADVAADAAQSMYGSMNLQFSSSANLVPMEYADLMTEGGASSTSYSPLNNVTVPNGYTTRAYTDGSKIGFQLTAPSGTSLDSATVKVSIAEGEAITATAGSIGALSGYVVDIPADVTVDSNTKITITVEGATTDSGT